MFDVYYKSLSSEEKDEFCKKIHTNHNVVRNAYLPKDPLMRRLPKPERMALMIIASGGSLNSLILLDYFYTGAIQQLLAYEGYESGFKDAKKPLSILEVGV